MRLHVVAVLALVLAGCSSADAAAPPVDATRAARANTAMATVAVSSPSVLSQEAVPGRCRPARGERWVFDPGRVSGPVVTSRVQRLQDAATARAPDARLVSVELRCRPGHGVVSVDAAFFSAQRSELWWSGQDGVAERSAKPLSAAKLRRRLREHRGRYMTRLLVTD